MSKQPLQDIVKKNARAKRPALSKSFSERRPIRETSPPENPEIARRPRPQKSRFSRPETLSSNLRTTNARPGKKYRIPKNWTVAVAGIIGAVLLLGFFLSILFSGATVTVFPRQQSDVFIDGTFFAKKEPGPGELAYTIMTIERTQSNVVDSTKQEEVQEYAVGEIIVFNEFDQNPQRLIKNTRFESPDGKIYRIRESVTVPGMSTNNAGELVPGQLEITVYADEPGTEYNVELTQFSIPGFEGTPRYEKFYGRSKTPIEGGYDGIRLVLNEDVEASARQQVREVLIEELKQATFSSSEKPEGYHLYEDAVFIDFASLPSVEVDDNQVEIREKGTIQAVLFPEDMFAHHLASSMISDFDDQPIELQNPEELSLQVEKVETEEEPWDGTTYSVTISGTADFIWKYDEDQLKRDLAGKHEEDRYAILSNTYPGIRRAEFSIRPFWRRTFPDAVEDISIIQVLD